MSDPVMSESFPSLILFHCPGACSQVTVCALEMADIAYELKLLNLYKGEQTALSYIAVSPLGKVPTLLVNGETMIENIALLSYIAALRPDAGVFPISSSPRMMAEALAGLSFCSGTLHPQIRGIANPQRITNGDGEPVRERSRYLAANSFAYAEGHLERHEGWWLEVPSIVDVYLNWAAGVARNAGLDMEAYPLVNELAVRLTGLPGFVKMLAIEAKSKAKLGI